jgi:hypothetical protein
VLPHKYQACVPYTWFFAPAVFGSHTRATLHPSPALSLDPRGSSRLPVTDHQETQFFEGVRLE